MRFRKIFLSAVVIGASACATMNAPIATTVAQGSRPEVVNRLSSALARDGYRITSANDYRAVFEKPGSLLTNMLAGSRMNPNTMLRLVVTMYDTGSGVHVTATQSIVTNPGTGFERVMELSGKTNAQLQSFLDSFTGSGRPGHSASISSRSVNAPSVELSAAAESETIDVGKTTIIVPSTGASKFSDSPDRFAWGSTNLSVATVSDKGVAVGVGGGTTCVTVTRFNITRCVLLKVVGEQSGRPTPSIVIQGPPKELPVGRVFQASAELRDSNDKPMVGEIVWGSLKPEYATVSDSGLVRARSPGPAAIAATANGVNKQFFFTVVK